jgi:hypothetical protein
VSPRGIDRRISEDRFEKNLRFFEAAAFIATADNR